jgi:hypothetical protein
MMIQKNKKVIQQIILIKREYEKIINIKR